MPTPRKLNVYFFFPTYGGNGGISAEVPDIRRWWTQVMLKCAKDERINHVDEHTRGDTPVTMVRNEAVLMARKKEADVLVMVDSDQNPLFHCNMPGWKEFFASSFDFLYDHYDRGPCVIGAPYCGPPGQMGAENVYVFEWQNYGEHDPETLFSLEQIPRMMAARMTGIQPCAALPTGMIMYDMRAFELIEPCGLPKGEVLDKLITGEITKEEALWMLHEGWFYYEWTDGYASEKASTEDVTNTRDISLAGCAKLGYNPVYCNWDSPVGHWKPWCVSGKPLLYSADNINATYRRALKDDIARDEVIVEASQLSRLPVNFKIPQAIKVKPTYCS